MSALAGETAISKTLGTGKAPGTTWSPIGGWGCVSWCHVTPLSSDRHTPENVPAYNRLPSADTVSAKALPETERCKSSSIGYVVVVGLQSAILGSLVALQSTLSANTGAWPSTLGAKAPRSPATSKSADRWHNIALVNCDKGGGIRLMVGYLPVEIRNETSEPPSSESRRERALARSVGVRTTDRLRLPIARYGTLSSEAAILYNAWVWVSRFTSLLFTPIFRIISVSVKVLLCCGIDVALCTS
jgi:hypothetical protein